MTDRSHFACPACGEHRLALIDFPEQHSVGYQPYSDIIGMGEPTSVSAPAIGCLACGSEWASLGVFHAATASQPAGPDGDAVDAEAS